VVDLLVAWGSKSFSKFSMALLDPAATGILRLRSSARKA